MKAEMAYFQWGPYISTVTDDRIHLWKIPTDIYKVRQLSLDD